MQVSVAWTLGEEEEENKHGVGVSRKHSSGEFSQHLQAAPPQCNIGDATRKRTRSVTFTEEDIGEAVATSVKPRKDREYTKEGEEEGEEVQEHHVKGRRGVESKKNKTGRSSINREEGTHKGNRQGHACATSTEREVPTSSGVKEGIVGVHGLGGNALSSSFPFITAPFFCVVVPSSSGVHRRG